MQTAEEFLASVGDTTDESVNVMFDRVDILDDPTRQRRDLDEVGQGLDYDPDDEYHNEQQASGLHPHYGGFDDPDAEDEDDYLFS